MTPFCELFKKFGSDKGGWHYRAGAQCHDFGPAYTQLFWDRRDQIKNVLEIGVAGGASLRTWKEAFPNAQIFGLDANQACLFAEDRIWCFHADQHNADDLDLVMALLGERKFDLIIDDGSHYPDHQIFSAKHLLPYLAERGAYIIEDIYPDCKPELVGAPIVEAQPDFVWRSLPTGVGLGVSRCGCGQCDDGEQLLVFTHS